MRSLIVALLICFTTAQDLTAQGILNDIQSAATCSACETLLLLLQGLAQTGDANFVSTITEVCILAKVEDDDVCQGVIAQQGPILAHDLRGLTVGSHTSLVLCASLFGLCPYPAPREYDVALSAKPSTSRPAPSGEEPLKVVHYSDIHVDLSYEVGANYNCTKPICCRPYTAADAPGNTSYPAGEFGNPKCDAPLSLEQSMYAAIQALVPDAAFVLFTGDLVEGAVWLVSEEENTGDIHDAYQNQMMSYFDLIYGTAGNHEAAPVNAFPPQTVSTSSQWVYDALVSAWQAWIGTDADAARAYGAYASDYSDKLKIISLNSNLYYNKNFWLFEPTMQYDPDGQFAWLVQQLQAAEDAQQSVYIIAHMPMGSSSALYDGSHYFNEIVNRYSSTIAAMFFGHTHKDQFEISYSDYSNQNADTAVAVSYVAPAMTPTSGNPSFRVYDVDPVTFGVLDYTEYYTASLDQPVWEKLYSAKEAYGDADELTPAYWHNVTELFEADDAVFQQYYSRKDRGYSGSTCDAACKTSEICQMRAGEAQYNCVALKPGLNFRKRDLEHHEVDDCDASLTVDVFAAVLGNERLLHDAVGVIKRAV